MLVSFPWWSLALLVAPVGAVSPIQGIVRALSPSSIPVLAVDSDPVPPLLPLTDTLLDHYIALKKDLAVFWRTHPALLATAKQHVLDHEVQMKRMNLRLVKEMKLFDYVALTAQDTAIAAVFTMHHVAPQQYEPTVDAVYKGLFLLDAKRVFGLTFNPTRLLDKNAALVAHHPEIEALEDHAVDVTLLQQKG